MASDTYTEIESRFSPHVPYMGEEVIAALKETREVVGNDPTEWWVDCNGEKVHIGEEVLDNTGDTHIIAFLGDGSDVLDEETSFVDMTTSTKIVPDTREKIIDDAIIYLKQPLMLTNEDNAREILAVTVDRAMKLGAVSYERL